MCALLPLILVTTLAMTGPACFLWAQEAHGVGESSLEPEFRQLRSQLRAMPEFSGSDAYSRFRLAEALAHRGDVHGAIAAYREASAIQPEWPDPYRGLGQVLLDHHDYAEAAEALEASIRAGRADHQGWYWLGRAYMGRGTWPQAAYALEQTVRLEPEDADALADLALVRMAQGEVAEAKRALSEALRLKPDDANIHRLRERLAGAGDDAAAVQDSARALLRELFEPQ